MSKNNLPLPRVRLRQEETDSIIFMLCSVTRFRAIQAAMENRLRSIPNGWRDIRMVEAVLDRLVGQLQETVPTDKLYTLKRLLPDTRVHITYTRQIGKGTDKVTGIHEKDLDLLTAVSHDAICKLCDGNCDRCDLGKVFDRFLFTERDKGESYTFMDMGKGYDVNRIRKGK